MYSYHGKFWGINQLNPVDEFCAQVFDPRNGDLHLLVVGHADASDLRSRDQGEDGAKTRVPGAGVAWRFEKADGSILTNFGFPFIWGLRVSTFFGLIPILVGL